MATGDRSDMIARIKRTLPRWFGPNGASTPVLDAVLAAPAAVAAFVYGLIVYARAQTRIATASGAWLDMIAADFFGIGLQRLPNQSDASYRARILSAILRERGTRKGVRKALLDLTGKEPVIVEVTRPADTGGYSTGGVGYGVGGAWGSLLLPYQSFVTAFRPSGSGVPVVGGYNAAAGPGYGGPAGYGVAATGAANGALEYASLDMMQGIVQDADIYAAIDLAKPAGTIVWARVS